MQDLFVSLDYTRFFEAKADIENKLAELIACRHEYPLWPHHDYQLDEYEEMTHGYLRHSYYRTTLYLIDVVRVLRSLG